MRIKTKYYEKSIYFLVRITAVIILLLSMGNTLKAEDSWQDQFLKYRVEGSKLSKDNEERGVKSQLIIRGEAPESIEYDVTGLEQLVMLVTTGPANAYQDDHAVWINAKVEMEDGSEVKLTDMSPTFSRSRVKRVFYGVNIYGMSVKVADKIYTNTIWCHADGAIVYSLPKGAKTFKSDIGIEMEGFSGSVHFHVVPHSIDLMLEKLKEEYPDKYGRYKSYMGENFFRWFVEEGNGVTDEVYSTLITKLKESKPKDSSTISKEFDSEFSTLKGEPSVEMFNLFDKIIDKIELNNLFASLNIDGYIATLNDISKEFPSEAKRVVTALKEAKEFKSNIVKLESRVASGEAKAIEELEAFASKQRVELLCNPYIKGKEILSIRHKVNNATGIMAESIGRNKNNWTTTATVAKFGWNNDLVKISDFTKPLDQVKVESIFKPEGDLPMKDFDLNWDGERVIINTVADNNNWHLFEMSLKSGELTQLTPTDHNDVDFYDACYLPDERIIVASNAAQTAIACVDGSEPVSDLYLLDRTKPKNRQIRQLNFGQDNDWNPVVMNDGKVAWLRWEYTDASHYFTRILMNMNPDGTNKKELYGSGSYFPNSTFDTRPIPGPSTQFVSIVSGHHGITRSGRMMIFDPSKSKKEAEGVIHEFPHKGRVVEPIVKDQMVDGVWPQFLNPYPLSENYFLATVKLTPNSLWGVYLVDRNDNMTLLYNHSGEAFVEPVLIEKRPTPPIIPDRVDESSSMCRVAITDIYEGIGLEGIPKGSVKELRIYAYQYSYNKLGSHDLVGFEGGWDVKRILGTVPVEPDGSAYFELPANTPISIQPLDDEGRAMQLMRSWMTGMPGELVSCVGCHEPQSMAPPAKATIAMRRAPSKIEKWEGFIRPISFYNDMKPVLEKRCVGCHDGTKSSRPNFADDSEYGYRNFSKSYMALHPYVRRPGPESDVYTLSPQDYLANSSDLVKMLKKGHHGVELDKEDWSKLYLWIDLNVPFIGKFDPIVHNGYNQVERRKTLNMEFGNVKLIGEDELAIADSIRAAKGTIPFIKPTNSSNQYAAQSTKGWPLTMDDAIAKQLKSAKGKSLTKSVEIADGVTIEFVKIPSGTYVMGDAPTTPERVVKIKRPFWISSTEMTNEMVRAIRPKHDSRVIDQQWKDHVFGGYTANRDEQPAIRISYNEAMEFASELAEKTGLSIDIPTEEQWEWAARAGADTDMYFGTTDDDFSEYENLADYTIRELAVMGVDPQPMDSTHVMFKHYDYTPKELRYNDHTLTPQGVAMFKPNSWRVYDMLGNVAEWTKSDYDSKTKVAKGGSWRDVPSKATAATRNSYLPYQRVYNVGVRLVINE